MTVAMILAAGRGERLRPLTDEIPKALCPVKGVPLIERHVINLAQAGFRRLVVNHAYLGGKIRQYLGSGKRWGVEIIYAPEPPGGLETGGGIFNALPWLGLEPFITVNADIYTDFDFSLLEPGKVDNLHLVLVHKNPKLEHHGDFGLGQNGLLTNKNVEFTYAGIACYHPQLFRSYSYGRYSIAPMLRQLVQEGKATGQVYAGMWHDIGSLERLREADLEQSV